MEFQRMGYDATLKWSKRFYKKIGRVYCPALNNEYVSFTRDGFNHLIRKSETLRSRKNQKDRLQLLVHAERIIKNPRAVIEYRQVPKKISVNRHGVNTLQDSTAHFWGFIHYVGNKKIKVVVRQLNNGQKHFFSIMGDRITKQKTP